LVNKGVCPDGTGRDRDGGEVGAEGLASLSSYQPPVQEKSGVLRIYNRSKSRADLEAQQEPHGEWAGLFFFFFLNKKRKVWLLWGIGLLFLTQALVLASCRSGTHDDPPASASEVQRPPM
jgi:hypothetical protein